MTEYSNENRGVLFKNDRKEKENQPDYTGSLNVKGDEFFLSAWLKTSSKGNKFMSVAVTPKLKAKEYPEGSQGQPQAGYGQQTANPFDQQQPADQLDDEIPW